MAVARPRKWACHRATVPRDWFPYLKSASQDPTPEDARLPARLRPVGDYAPEGIAYSSERRTVISVVAASDSCNIRTNKCFAHLVDDTAEKL
jgi:hypothetical protein